MTSVAGSATGLYKCDDAYGGTAAVADYAKSKVCRCVDAATPGLRYKIPVFSDPAPGKS